MATAYNVINIDLTLVVATPTRLAATAGKRVSSVFVSQFPVGQTAYLRFGAQNADRIQIAVNQTFSFCPSEGDGIFFEQPIAGAGTLQLILAYADSESEKGLVVNAG